MPYIDWSVPGPNMDALRERVAGESRALHYTLGDDPNVTQEKVAGAIVEALDLIAAGNYEELIFD